MKSHSNSSLVFFAFFLLIVLAILAVVRFPQTGDTIQETGRYELQGVQKLDELNQILQDDTNAGAR